MKILKTIISVFCFMSISILFSCKNDMKEINAFIQEDVYPDISVENIESLYSNQAKINAKVISPLVNKYMKTEEPYLDFPKGVEVFFLDNEGKTTSSLKSDYAIYYERKKLGVAQKNVILKNSEGTVLTTEELFIDEAAEKIYTSKYVKITETSGFEMEGLAGFESNMNFTVYRFNKVVGQTPVNNFMEQDSTKTEEQVKVSNPEKVSPKKKVVKIKN